MTQGQVSSATSPLLVELFTEELPPRALQRLGQAFADGVQQSLARQQLLADDCHATVFATPRRLGVRLSAVRAQAPTREFREKLMPAKVGLADDGSATPALQKKLATKGWQHLTPGDLERESDGKQDYLYHAGSAPGAMLTEGLQEALEHALGQLPIPKVMTYQLADGDTTVRFVRPAHRLLALHGSEVVAASVLGLQSDRYTEGHRFQASVTPIAIEHADGYEKQLADTGAVIASFEARRSLIRHQLDHRAAELGSSLGHEADVAELLDEVTALVERPAIYVGEFEQEFLAVPPECLILTMRLNQKYFPLFDASTGKLTHRFLIVSNMQLDDPANIVLGNQRVVRPRLADARFFYDTDRRHTLESRLDALDAVVYHNRLGSQRQRAERVAALAQRIAEAIGADSRLAARAARLAKADLVTQMVGEFPELQGVMGAYYAEQDGEDAAVVQALSEQYRIRFEHAIAPNQRVSAALFLADRIETLAGIWAIGQLPTGDRDPFGLRRAALGVISVFEQLTAAGQLDPAANDPGLTIEGLLDAALAQLGDAILPVAEQAAVRAALRQFIDERYRHQLLADHDRQIIDAVLALQPPLHQIPARVAAVGAFRQLPEAESLAAANKRIGNLLKKADEVPDSFDPAVLHEAAEQRLAEQIRQLEPVVAAHLAEADFTQALSALAGSRDAVDTFFNDVMVMAEDPAVRANRLALLATLHRLMNQVADLGRLA